MTIITDENGTRWVEIPARKRRKSPRALRFAEIKVGDQLTRKWPNHLSAGMVAWYYLVTDVWFDPVAGQMDEIAGRMVGIQHIDCRSGDLQGRKQPHTIRGLASQGFQYAEIDYMAHVKATNQATAEGAVIGIGRGHVIRQRPKVPGTRF